MLPEVRVAGCASPRPHPEPAPLVAKTELPPHVVEVAQGLYSSERGYPIRQGSSSGRSPSRGEASEEAIPSSAFCFRSSARICVPICKPNSF